MQIDGLTAIFGAIGGFIGFLLTLFTFTRNRDKDVKAKAAEQATINAKLDNINVGVDSLRVDFKLEQRERTILSERVARVEESAQQAHDRLDKLEK